MRSINKDCEKQMPAIDAFLELGSHYELNIVQTLLEDLDHPERDLDIIHVAGTNGKGSTVSYLAHAFFQQKINVMTFTSPQLRQYLDRFSFNGQAVEQKDFDLAEAIVLEAAGRIAGKQSRHATVFEMEVAISFILAKNLGARLFIMETGLGGRLDATNAVERPLATVLTSISLDHKAELGDSITAVAQEKAGIIKPGVPVFSTVQLAEAEKVLGDRAAELEAPFRILSEADIDILTDSLDSQCFIYDGHSYTIHLSGKHQILNAALAVMVLSNLPQPYSLSPETIGRGLELTDWKGSFELIARKPDIILDGAHNPDAAIALSKNLRQFCSKGKCFGILHIFKDKDVVGVLQAVAGIFDKIWLPQMHKPRSLPAEQLQEICRKYLQDTECLVMPSLKDAVAAVKAEAAAEDTIVVFGSLSHLEAARKALIEIDEVVIK
ncbi:MAG: hypothetical protein GX034_02055 [Clostridiaceae bacterium]|nr:hypothetical protein [Clostridiaceae bacterium]